MRRLQPKRQIYQRRESAMSLRQKHLIVEALESRALLSAISVLDGVVATPSIELLPMVTNTTPRGYTPSQIAQAYGFSGITFNGGAVKGDGNGQTIAIVDAYNDPNIVNDLHVFDQTFGLANPPKFSVVNQNGGSSLPATDAGWSEEIALDVEWAHAMAPGANILLVEANSSSLNDLLAAVNTARNTSGVSVVSMSWGTNEFQGEARYDQYFTTPSGHTPITFTASAGDSGAQALWPAISSNVLSVGGTALQVSNSTYAGETAWSGSGGGTSQFESEPSYQTSVQSTGRRTSPDVSYDASPNTGFAVYDSVTTGGRSGWFQIGGTSAGAPQWASIVAIANQGRALGGQSTLAGGQAALYNLPSTDFHDVTSGSNGNSAKVGYDLVTGRGTPIASAVVRDLVANVAVSSTPTTPTPSTPTTPTSPTQSTPTAPSYHYELIFWHGRWWIIAIPNGTQNAVATDQIDSGMSRVETALTITTTATDGTATSAGLSSTVSTAASNSPQAGGSLFGSATMTLAMAPHVDGASGNLGMESSNGLDFAPAPGSPGDQWPGSNDPAPAQPAPGESERNLNGAVEALADGLLGLVAGQMTSTGSPIAPEAIDMCLADDGGLAPLVEIAAAPTMLASSWESDLVSLAIGLAIAANCRKDRSEAPELSPDRSGRQILRLDPK